MHVVAVNLYNVFCVQALVSSIIFNAVQSWALKIKGPVYVAMFKPFSILIAIVMGVMFLGDTLYLGRLRISNIANA